jgi:hypothetical protein
MLMVDRKKLGEILVELRILSPAEVERVLLAMRRRPDQTKFGQVARDMGLLREEHILAALAVQMQLFPRVADMSLGQLLHCLQGPVPATPLQNLNRPTQRRREKTAAH